MIDFPASSLPNPESVASLPEDSLIAMPRVYEQPRLMQVRRGRIANIEALIACVLRNSREGPLGREMQQLSNEFSPLTAWANSCWDYLLTVEGCRFLPRHSSEKTVSRGDYRAFISKDFSRLVNQVLQDQILHFAREPHLEAFPVWIRNHFWPTIVDYYTQLNQPQDSNQRDLTGYSYLRCTPYRFLNPVHQNVVENAMKRLSLHERKAVSLYFFHFYSLSAIVEKLNKNPKTVRTLLLNGLSTLYMTNSLAYSLLRQIERY